MLRPGNTLQHGDYGAENLLSLGFLMTPSYSESKYPPARKADVVDDYHGTLVPDPYRWLEEATSEETLAWVEAQNALTEKFIASYPERETIRKRLTELWDYPKYSLPTKEANRYFFRKNDGLQNQSVLFMQEGLEGDPVDQPTQHWPVAHGHETVGHVTDACWSPRLKKNIGYVWVPIELAEPGTRLDIETDDGTRVGTTATLPFIDPNKKVPAA